MLSFAWIWVLALLPVPWLLARRSREADAAPALRVAPDAFVGAGFPAGPDARAASTVGWRQGLMWTFVILATARPQLAGEVDLRPVSGRDWMLALDVSASMATRDLRAEGQALTRLAAAQRAAQHFIGSRAGDRFGLIVFASQAWLYAPLSWDATAIGDAIGAAQIGLAGRETALGDAVALASKRLGEAHAAVAHEVVVVSDGVSTAGALSPQQAGWLAQRAGVRVHGLEIVGRASKDKTGTSADGSSIEESQLAQLAAQTGGHFARVTDAAGLAAFYDELARKAPLERPRALAEAQELYAWPLGLALLLALAGALPLPPRRPRVEATP